MRDDSNRDDFVATTRDLLGKRSGYICAYPGCKRMTVAGSEDRQSGLTMTGVAAHITAAARDGPRYDKDMSPEERASETNGIWACQIHGKFIDDNPSKCTVIELRRWKAQHEKWVFDRVESGTELFNNGVQRVKFGHVGKFLDDYTVPFGRHNVLVGDNGSGKTAFCEILSAFSGGDHWRQFNSRFDFSEGAEQRAFIEVSRLDDHVKTSVRLSPQFAAENRKGAKARRQRIHIEVNGCPSPDWPRTLFRVLYFNDQLYRNRPTDPKNTFIKAIRYLANVLGTDEDLIWDSLREELFMSSELGYRFRRTGNRQFAALVPDGRAFYVAHGALGSREQQYAFLDMTLKLLSFASRGDNWIYIFDTAFFLRLDDHAKASLFMKLTDPALSKVQTLFCLNSAKDAEVLKGIQSDKWVNAEKFGQLTLHSFL
jgi:hypothetical protein